MGELYRIVVSLANHEEAVYAAWNLATGGLRLVI